MYSKTTWIDKAVQYAKRYYMNWDGGNDKNLLPPFTDWTLDSHAVATSDYLLTLTATAANQISNTANITIIPNTQYILSAVVTSTAGLAKIDVDQFDANGNLLLGGSPVGVTSASGTLTLSFTSDTNAKYVRVYLWGTVAGTFTFTNPQLELGSSATSFAPKKMYTINQSGGAVTAAGTAVNAANLNNIEQGIADAHALAMNMQVLFHMGAV